MGDSGRTHRPDPERGGDAPPIGAATRRYAVLGHPVAHSLSPRMQNAAFRAAGHDAVYGALDVPPARLAETLARLHAEGYAGLNVTLPHKEETLRLAHSATDAARAAGAANTLRRSALGWEAEATDGTGFIAWLASLGVSPSGSRALLLGAGGAARSVALALAQGGAAAVRIVNRSPDRAAAVVQAARAGAPTGATVESAPWGGAPAGEHAVPRFDYLVRALSVEAVSEEERRWWRRVAPRGLALDLNYGERARLAREEASRMGLRYEEGLALLVEQGALSYEFWTGERAPRNAMREALGIEST